MHSRRGGHTQEQRPGDAGVDAGARAVGPADRPVPGGGALGGHVRARPRLLLQRQAALAAHVRRRRQPGYHTCECHNNTYLLCTCESNLLLFRTIFKGYTCRKIRKVNV